MRINKKSMFAMIYFFSRLFRMAWILLLVKTEMEIDGKIVWGTLLRIVK